MSGIDPFHDYKEVTLLKLGRMVALHQVQIQLNDEHWYRLPVLAGANICQRMTKKKAMTTQH